MTVRASETCPKQSVNFSWGGREGEGEEGEGGGGSRTRKGGKERGREGERQAGDDITASLSGS